MSLNLIVTKLKEKFPEAYKYSNRGQFMASLTGNIHSLIPMYQITELAIDRLSKETVGLSGIAEKKSACKTWVRTNHFVAALRQYLDVKSW